MDSSGNLYGTTPGRASGDGTVFECRGQRHDHHAGPFTGTDGVTRRRADHGQQRQPLRHNRGRWRRGYGTVFEVAPGTRGITTLASFNGGDGGVRLAA